MERSRIKKGENFAPRKQQYQLLETSEYFDQYEKFSTFFGISRRLIYTITLVVTGLILATMCILSIRSYSNQEFNYLGAKISKSKLGSYKNYAVSTDAAACAPVGARLIDKGGSAVDAAIGTLLCMGLVIPNSMGLGGGCLMVIYDRPSGEFISIDGRDEAPDYATQDMFGSDDLAASRGPLSVGVPGELAAYAEAHQRYGKLNWSELFEEPIRMAEQGVELIEHMSYAMRNTAHSKHMRPSLRALFTNPDTYDFYKIGDIVKRPDLARTLRRIRDHGRDEFYGGQTGRLFIEDLRRQGGKMTLDNLMRYQVRVRQAIRVKLENDLILYTQPLPGSGNLLSLILRVMSKFGYYGKHDVKDSFDESELFYHRLVEAYKFAYAQRGGLEDYYPENNTRMIDLLEKLNSDKIVEEIVSKIQTQTLKHEEYGGSENFVEDHGTAHASVIDKEGSSVAVTTSVNLYFGAGLLSESTGLIYNDVMDDFVSPKFKNKFGLAPSKYNRIAPGKRPLSSMVPSIFTNDRGDVRLSLGASGGSKITTATAFVCLRNLYLGEDIKAAIDAPRLHHQFWPNTIVYEKGFPRAMLDALQDRGHNVSLVEGRSSVVMAVASNITRGIKFIPIVVGATKIRVGFDPEVITANSDYRKGGTVDGA